MLDVTVDLETTGLAPTAAVISLGAVAWKKDAEDTPFLLNDEKKEDPFFNYYYHVDLRSLWVLGGFTFEKKTHDWWASQSQEAKNELTASDNEDMPCYPIQTVILGFFDWINSVKEVLGEKEVRLWAQGTDFDLAILRNLCSRLVYALPVQHTHFRDHRTYMYEIGDLIYKTLEQKTVISDHMFLQERSPYALVSDYKEKNGVVHSPVYDCKRSIYTTWQLSGMVKRLLDTSDPDAAKKIIEDIRNKVQK